MDIRRKNALGGGCLLALCLMGGVAWGLYARQPSVGFLAGLGAGLAVAILLWLIDLARR